MLWAKVTELSFSAWDADLLPSSSTRIFQEFIAGNVTLVLLLSGITGPHPLASKPRAHFVNPVALSFKDVAVTSNAASVLNYWCMRHSMVAALTTAISL